MNIVTTLVHNDKGTPAILAKGGGKQKRTPYDHALSHDVNHGNAAGNLILVLAKTSSWVIPDALESIEEGNAVHTTENGARHRFSL